MQVFSWEYCEIFISNGNSYFEKHLGTAASEKDFSLKKNWIQIF